MTDKIDNRYTFQQEARMIFGNLITPAKVGKKGMGKGAPVYSASVILKPDGADLAGLKAVAARVAKAQWPGRNLGELKFPFSDGKKEADKATAKGKDGSFFLGHVLFKAYTGEQYPPALVVPVGGQLKVLDPHERATIGKAKFYNGCIVGLSVSFKAYNGEADGGVGPQSGVKAWLSSVVWLGEGERIGGSAVETFRHFAGSVSAENPLGEEEIAF